MSRIAWVTAIVLSTIVVLALLWEFSQAVLLFVLSLAVAAALRPLIQAFVRRGFPHSLALTLSYGMVLVVIIGSLVAVSGPLLLNIQRLADNLLIGYEWTVRRWSESAAPIYQGLAEQLPPASALDDTFAEERINQLVQAAFGFAQGVFAYGSQLAIVFVLSIYWTVDRVRFERLWLSALPVDRRSKARDIWRAIEKEVGAHLGNEALLSILSAVLLWVGYRLLGVEYAALLAVLAALLRLIPWFGAVLAAVPPFLVGLGGDPGAAVGAALVTIVVLVLLSQTLGARLFPRRPYNPILFVLIVFPLGESFGIVGVLLAPPLTVAIQILFGHLFQPYNGGTKAVVADQLADLKARLSEINEQAGDPERPLPQETLSLTGRLMALADKTQSFLDQ